MKLDRIGFAMVVAFVSELQQRDRLDGHDINCLDELIDIEVPEPVTIRANAVDADRLIELMLQGTQKIEAIKQYRMMTGMGLKESKDAVERYWVSKPIKEEGATLGDILGTAVKGK